MEKEKEKEKDKNKVVIPVVASIGGLLFISVIAGIVFWIARSKGKQQDKDVSEMDRRETNINIGGDPLETRRRQLTYSEVVRVTNNFERILGRGSFGAVYHGLIDDIQVAVKMLAPSAIQSHEQFKAEESTYTEYLIFLYSNENIYLTFAYQTKNMLLPYR